MAFNLLVMAFSMSLIQSKHHPCLSLTSIIYSPNPTSHYFQLLLLITPRSTCTICITVISHSKRTTSCPIHPTLPNQYSTIHQNFAFSFITTHETLCSLRHTDYDTTDYAFSTFGAIGRISGWPLDGFLVTKGIATNGAQGHRY